MGAISYACAGEVNPHISVAWNTIINNCRHIPTSNISTCDMPIMFQLQNTQSLLLHVRIYFIFIIYYKELKCYFQILEQSCYEKSRWT